MMNIFKTIIIVFFAQHNAYSTVFLILCPCVKNVNETIKNHHIPSSGNRFNS